MLTLVVVFLVAWAILAVVGFALKGLLWLGIIGVILFIGTVAIAFIRRGSTRRKTRA